MNKGFLATLFAAAVSFAGTTAAFAAAPVITGIPDLQVGDMEDNIGSDNNYFVFTNAFQFSSKVTDADTTAGALLWSFAEYNLPGSPFTDTVQEYQINGKNPIAVGASAIATETSNGLPNAKNPGANRLNATSDFASFRDILFSPTAGSPPFATGIGARTAAQIAWAGNAGKNVVFYAADPEGNVDDDLVIVKTKDQGFDLLSSGWTVKDDDGGPPLNQPFAGWVESGLNDDVSQPAKGGTDLVDRADNTNTTTGYETGLGEPTTNQTDIGAIVRAASGRSRIVGWINKTGLAYPGASSYVRGKFYVYTNNAAADVTNKYPNFRARMQHGGAVLGSASFQYAATGNTGGTGGELAYALTDDPNMEAQGAFLKPSRTPAKPSLYRVDFDPVDVPSAGAATIQPCWESFAFNDPAAAVIMLAQCTIGTFPSLTDAAGTPVLGPAGAGYSRLNGTAAAQGFTAAAGNPDGSGLKFSGFNAENDFTFGYKQNLYISTGTFSVGSEAAATGLTQDTGITNGSYTNRFVVGIIDLLPAIKSDRPRIAPGKYYRARFHASSDVATTGTGVGAAGSQRQGNVRFRLQTAASVINTYLEITGTWNTNGNAAATSSQEVYVNTVIGGQALPGSNSANPDKDVTLMPAGQNGGWYTVLMPSPLNGDIRRDVSAAGVVDATTFGTLFTAPARGVNSDSVKDIKAGLDIYTGPINLILGGGTINNFYDNNRAKVSIQALKIYEYDAASVVDDGGYAY